MKKILTKILKIIVIYIIPIILFVVFIANAQYFIDDIANTYNPIFPTIKFWGSLIVFTAYFETIFETAFLDILYFFIWFIKLFLTENAILKIERFLMKVDKALGLSKWPGIKGTLIIFSIIAIVNIISANILFEYPGVLFSTIFIGVVTIILLFVGIPLAIFFLYLSFKAIYLFLTFQKNEIKIMFKKNMSFFEILFEH